MATLAELVSQRTTAAASWQTLCAQLRAAYIELAALDQAVVNGKYNPAGNFWPTPSPNTSNIPPGSSNCQVTGTPTGMPILGAGSPRSFNGPLELPQHQDVPLPAWPNQGDAIRARLQQLIA